MRFTAAEIAHAVEGTLVGPDGPVDGASIDSRSLRAGQLFVPISGDRDGHDFLPAAIAAGAGAVLTARPDAPGLADATVPTIVVPDTAAAFTALGAHARRRLPDRVVGITGSVGKTSTKDLAAAALATRRLVAASEKSFNNELGLPLTLVNAANDTEVTVVEMGARGPGHIAELCATARPTVAVVTAVELVHSEHMGGLEGIARCKAELVEALPDDGVAVLNAASALVAAMASLTRARVVRFGTEDAEVRARDVVLGEDLRPRFTLDTDWGRADVHLVVRGEHQIANALAAAAVALVSDVPIADVAAGLARGELSPWRMDLRTAPSGARVLNDAYNAGPASTAAALRALAALDARRHVAVLGPMAELGADSPAQHRRIAELADELGVEVLAFLTDEYGSGGVDDIDEVLARLGEVGEGDAVLVKGSRVAGLERVAERLLR